MSCQGFGRSQKKKDPGNEGEKTELLVGKWVLIIVILEILKGMPLYGCLAYQEQMKLADTQLIQQIAKGNQRAMEQLYARYRLAIWRYLWYRLGENAALVEETLQEVFLAVWRSAARYRGEAQVETWILRIAQHIVLNTRRNLSRTIEGSQQQDHTEAYYNEMDTYHPQRSYEEQILERLHLGEALSRLSDKYRVVLELTFYCGFSCEEVAHILNIPTGTVKSRIHSARQKLLAELAETKQKRGQHI